MLRKGARGIRALPKRDRWHALQEYALGETNQEQFRLLRLRDTGVSNVVAGYKATPKPIDWAAWEGRISNKEVFGCLKGFHQQQTALLEGLLAEDHAASVKKLTQGWELFDSAVTSCQHSVQKSEEILRNGARALWISFQNPPISLLSQSEWLDADQYWQAFVEKHHYYHDHLLSAVEDPESKEYDAKQKADLKDRWERFDGRGTTRQNNKLLYQRPSFEYYDVFRGPLVEHMIFYLTKTGGDCRFFPENMPVQWFAEIYNTRFKILEVLQKKRRQAQEATLSREGHLDFHPHDLEHDGEGYYARLIAKEAAATELLAARLMGNFILFSDAYIPVQTSDAFQKATAVDGGKGTFYTLGADVHALFYKPAGEALPTPDPVDSYKSLETYVNSVGRSFEIGYAAAFEGFTEILSSRKEGLGGHWFNAPGESSSAAFLRRLKKTDPAYEIWQSYVKEHAEKWAAAKALSIQDAKALLPEIERKYQLEVAEHSATISSADDSLGGHDHH